MMLLHSLIREHMEVVGSDGGHVGKVDHVLDEEIELARLDRASGFRHHCIPMSWVDHIEDDKVWLNMSRSAATTAWREKH